MSQSIKKIQKFLISLFHKSGLLGISLYVFFTVSESGLVAQNRIPATSNNGWYMYFGNHRLSEKIYLHTEYQWRRHDVVSNWQQSLARVGVDYYFSNNISVTAGYGLITSWPYGEQPVAYVFNEHRAWQQLITKHTSGKLYFNHRYRLEQRWLEGKTQDSNGKYVFDQYQYRNRVRYRLMVNIPLFKKQLDDKTWFVALYDEVFIAFGKNVAKNIFDQNRLSASLGYWYNKNFNIQLGYMYHTILKPDAVRIENNNNFQLGITYNFDLTSGK